MKPYQISNADDVIRLLEREGDSEYGGEPVTQIEHALQSAALAEGERAGPELIAAALLHDVGHLLHSLPDDAPDKGIDDRHEHSGFHLLQRIFPAEVYEPIRMHVDAKRYLCAVDAEYSSQLSDPSIVSLELQGGVMSQQEARQFESKPHFDAAIHLRRWDDTAKTPQLATPTLDHYAEIVRSVANKRDRNA